MRGLLDGTWWAAWILGAAPGLYLALVGSTFGAWATVGAMGAVVGACGHSVFVRSAPTGPQTCAPQLTAARAAVGFVSAAAWIGLASVSDRLGLVYALICASGFALTSPARGRSPRKPNGRPEPLAPHDDGDQDALRLVVRAWSFDQLCWAWRISQHRAADPDPRRRLDAVTQRAILLDEIERRDPAAFASWLAADPTASDDPGNTPSRRPDGDVA